MWLLLHQQHHNHGLLLSPRNPSTAAAVFADGAAAGLVSAVVSGVPSVSIALARVPSLARGAADVLFSLQAVGSVLTGPTAPLKAMYAAGLLLHLSLSFGYSLLLAALTTTADARNNNWSPPPAAAAVRMVLVCVLAGICIHWVNLVLLPRARPAPLLSRLLRATGHLPHLLDHLAFALSVAGTLILRRSRRSRSIATQQ